MANEATYALASTINAISGAGSGIPSGSFATNIATVDASLYRYPLLKMEFRGTINTTSSSTVINIYIVPIGIDDTNYASTPDSGWQQYFRGSFKIKDNTGVEQIAIEEGLPCPINGKFKVFLENTDASVAVNSGWDLDIVPYTYAPAS